MSMFWENNKNSWRNRESLRLRAHLKGQLVKEVGIFAPVDRRGKERDLAD